MSFDEQLAARVRTALGSRREINEISMFGGLAFMYRGHMVCGVVGDELMVRMKPKDCEEALTREGARPMDFTGRPMKGMLFVGKEGIRTRPRLERWVRDSLAYVSALEAKRGS
jgi:TfoX/Sxy family transcriptional regulator of competence genes